jgi:hypothetical protein
MYEGAIEIQLDSSPETDRKLLLMEITFNFHDSEKLMDLSRFEVDGAHEDEFFNSHLIFRFFHSLNSHFTNFVYFKSSKN